MRGGDAQGGMVATFHAFRKLSTFNFFCGQQKRTPRYLGVWLVEGARRHSPQHKVDNRASRTHLECTPVYNQLSECAPQPSIVNSETDSRPNKVTDNEDFLHDPYLAVGFVGFSLFCESSESVASCYVL